MTKPDLQLTTAYGACRHIARTAAKNFYYGFMLLPTSKRNALSAVYAFMRHADDISDEPGMSPIERRTRLSEFLDNYHRVAEGGPTDDPVFLALRDAQQRYDISMELLDKLVAGTGMDIREDVATHGGLQIEYATFNQLYDYCYHVASVVGLVCIKIFGYHDPVAEQHAEHLGIAFQLTNIIRDVKEDAAMGRIYLPREDMDQFGITAEELATGTPLEKIRPLLAMEAKRAQDYYRAAGQLLPLIDDVSQPALWAMTEIYHGVLDKIEAKQYDVYSERVRLTVPQKLKVVLKGFGKKLA